VKATVCKLADCSRLWGQKRGNFYYTDVRPWWLCR